MLGIELAFIYIALEAGVSEALEDSIKVPLIFLFRFGED